MCPMFIIGRPTIKVGTTNGASDACPTTNRSVQPTIKVGTRKNRAPSANRVGFGAAGISQFRGDLLRRLDHVLDDAVLLHVLRADLRHRDRYRSDRPAGVIEERRADAVQSFFDLFVVLGIALTPGLLKVLAQQVGIGDGVLRCSGRAAWPRGCGRFPPARGGRASALPMPVQCSGRRAPISAYIRTERRPSILSM